VAIFNAVIFNAASFENMCILSCLKNEAGDVQQLRQIMLNVLVVGNVSTGTNYRVIAHLHQTAFIPETGQRAIGS
jgi:hypothetical protein